MAEPGAGGDEGPAGPSLVGHVHLKVADLERAIDFYEQVLGLELTEHHDRYAFLSFGERHHDVALQEIGEQAGAPAGGVGLYHVAFEVQTAAELRSVYEALRDRGAEVSPVDHGISKALYSRDPDGNGVEVYLDTRAANDTWTWDGRNRRFDPASL